MPQILYHFFWEKKMGGKIIFENNTKVKKKLANKKQLIVTKINLASAY